MKTETKGHLELIRILNELGFEVVSEYRIGKYWIDCWVEELNIAFEYDGPSHGLRKKTDAKRDLELIGNYGVRKVIRIKEKDFASTDELKEKISSEIC